jgi:hypothetical protein
MRKFLSLIVSISSLIIVSGCSLSTMANGTPCLANSDCMSGICSANKCVGKTNGSTCKYSGECDSKQCTGSVCVVQTCNPICTGLDVCIGDRCAPYLGLDNGASCMGVDEVCSSLICNRQASGDHKCEPRSVGSFCTQDANCASGAKCVGNACQQDFTCNNVPCSVGQKCSAGSCQAVLLPIKSSCIRNSDCVTGFCDPLSMSTCQFNASVTCNPACGLGQVCSGVTCVDQNSLPNGSACSKNSQCASSLCNNNVCTAPTCTPQYPSPATVACGTPVLPNNNCGTTSNGTGTMCASGLTCNGTTCVAPTLDGVALYGTYCASCHGPLATSNKKNRTAIQTQNAINSNAGGMGSLSSLSAAQVAAITAALSTTTVSDFTISAPASVSVVQGGSTPVVVSTTATGTGTAVTITLSNSAVSGVTTFAPVSGTAGFTSTLTVSAVSTLAVGSYILTVNGTAGTIIHSASVTINVTASGTVGLPNGSSCSVNSDCATNNCGLGFAGSTAKVCNGVLDIDQACTNHSDCHSGTCIVGKNTCAPDQFRICGFYYGTDVEVYGPAGLNRTIRSTSSCVTSDPSKDDRSAVARTTVWANTCTQYTFWMPGGGSCSFVAGSNKGAIWNTGRVYQ